jgi:hypothetical protein
VPQKVGRAVSLTAVFFKFKKVVQTFSLKKVVHAVSLKKVVRAVSLTTVSSN